MAMKLKAICAVAANGAIGRKGQLLFRLPSDLKQFRERTLGQTCIMGRKTLESMPNGQPLPGRNTIVVSRTMPEGLFWEKDGFAAVAVPSKQAAFDALYKYGFTGPVVCGGAQIYGLFLEDCDELILTETEQEVEDADAYFPQFRERFEIAEEGPLTEENGLTYRINIYKRSVPQGLAAARLKARRLRALGFI